MQRKLKKEVVYALYGLAFCFMIAGLFFVEKNSKNNSYNSTKDYDYVTDSIIEDSNIPVVAKSAIIIRPYNAQNVSIVTNYYDMEDDEETQKKSIIYYENTYMPSSGVAYGSDNEFDVISILDGKVSDVREDDTLGNVITIEHENGIVSTYQSIKDILVKKGDEVKQGSPLAKSSKSNLLPDLENILYFELAINGETVNPEKYFDKSVDEV